jgi:hypothetical protein
MDLATECQLEKKKTSGNCIDRIKVYKLKLQENQTEFQRKITERLETWGSNPNTEDVEESWNNLKQFFSAAEAVCGKEKKKQSPWRRDKINRRPQKVQGSKV